MNVYLVTAVILLFYIALAWIAGNLLHLTGATLWLFRIGLMLIGAAAAGLFLWFHFRLKRRQTTAPGVFAGVSEQIKFLLRQAEQKLVIGKQGTLSSLPIVFVLGEVNSAKTSSLIHSGLEPELIAGHVFGEEGKVVPTGTVNVWFARKTVFIEAGGKLAANPQLWAQVLRHTRPKRISAAVGKGQQAPRAVLICVDCEHLSSSQPSVQNLANRLKETARSLGAPFPVYVLFTKLDLVKPPGDMKPFDYYVSNLASDESSQILGATLPRTTTHGVFEQEESKRLTRAFDQIVYSLAEKRLDLLSRETLAERMPGTYEFPRELRKRRDQVVQLLVELTRPTQLSANPFLRGFYFCGVRPVIVNEAVSVPAARRAAAPGSGATRMFNYAEEARSATPDVPARSVQSLKKPEWTFLSHLFTDVILSDRAAFSASHQSSRVEGLRRALLAFVVVLLLFFAIALLVSFAKNSNLENQIAEHARRLNAISPGSAVENPTLEQLRTLDEVRDSVDQLARYQVAGPPLSYRFGLYTGDRIYPPAYALYFQNFRRFLLASAQSRMVAVLRQTPATKTSDDFQTMYSTLKAYLITTSNHEYASWNSFVPVLLENSPAFKNRDADSQYLVSRQFTFYAGILPAASPYGPEKDTAAVENARAYLKQFDAVEAIYQAMLDDAAKGNHSVNFNRRFPQATPFVVDNYDVPAAFTKEGYAVMQKSLQNPEKFRGEEWVLGTAPTVNFSAASLRATLISRYAADYLKHWRAYLRSGHVVAYANLKDASAKLSKLTANDSPLLQLLWLAKENTTVEIPELKDPLEAVQMIARDSNLERLVGSGSQEYMGALSALQNSVQTVVNTPNGPTDPGMLGQIQQSASGASGTAKRIEQRFPIDTQGGADRVDKNVSRLLEEPIDFANDAAKRAAGAGAESVCAVVNLVTAKRPFNPRSSQQATLQEVQDLFRPQGTLWTSLQSKLGTAVQRQGSNWVNVGSTPQSQSFLGFLNRAQQFTDTLFPGGTATTHLGYSLLRLPAPGIDQAVLVIDGQSLTDVGRAQQFTWQGGNSSVSLNVTAAGQKLPGPSAQGPWALFEFFDTADTWTGNNPATLAWQLRVEFGRRTVGSGTKTEVQYQLTTQGAQVFKKEFLAGLRCSAR
jgi:type VI secretion system protein ImpL